MQGPVDSSVAIAHYLYSKIQVPDQRLLESLHECAYQGLELDAYHVDSAIL